ncbi:MULTISPECIES: hypothetical protein [Paraburkholderia]|uniref:hypothetical protein n=1 Tax=Paraburkholderia TaxID=1822464 RepID=UPI00101AA7A5|nr:MULTISPECIES: hypothetical protein [Paraburkholderia]
MIRKTGSQFAMAARSLQHAVRKGIVIIAVNRFSGVRLFSMRENPGVRNDSCVLRINRGLTLISANLRASGGIRKANVIVAGSAFNIPRVTRQKSRKIFGRTLENAFERIANFL